MELESIKNIGELGTSGALLTILSFCLYLLWKLATNHAQHIQDNTEETKIVAVKSLDMMRDVKDEIKGMKEEHGKKLDRLADILESHLHNNR